ncbi:hypothetical protein N657DRAFT_300150 [Parathielavia appendiculata]|uniref:Uncharacterized protein n=1 Tax=Parathielavia appendiculata TaxID=2587402 RepID=A0AAN6U4E0_9PEZI|nr:hypothetical protein N657DRAFT_300150 [Parathielavia appendiculata]
MSVFSMIKRGRQAAKEHKAELAKKQQEEAQKAPYKHIPRHAAIDAMSGGPAGWRENDRVRIVEQNRRRSAMTASGMNMSGIIAPVHAGLPRVQSALSHVSYPSAYASPIVQVPRTYSYSSMPAGWIPHGREMSYSPIDMGSVSVKGKEVERIMDSSRTSRSSSKVSAGRIPLVPGGTSVVGDSASSPVESSSNSTSSQDDLEMKPVVRHSVAVPIAPSSTTTANRSNKTTSETESVHRLHPGRSRRVSDPNQSAAASRSSLAAGIPPVPALPPMQFGTAITTPDTFPSATSSASSVTMVPVGSSASLAAKAAATPAVLKEEAVEAPHRVDIVTAERPIEEEVAAVKTPSSADSPTKKGRRTSKMTRFTELEPIRSHTTGADEEKKRATSTVTVLPTDFDESALPAPKEFVLSASAPPPPTSSKPGKLSKSAAAASGGKLVKKNRWSLRSSKSAAVAV